MTEKTPILDALEKATEAVVILGVLAEVGEEIRSAREKHGVQNHLPIGNNPYGRILAELHKHNEAPGYGLEEFDNEDVEELAKRLCESGDPNWMKIILEEFFEAAAARSDGVRGELVQLSAMATSAVVALDSQRDDR